MLEIDVDVGRLLALAGDKPLEEQFMLDRVDQGYAEQIADAAVRGGAPALAEDAATSALGDDRIDGQEIGRVAQLVYQPELVIDLIGVGLRNALREFRSRGLFGQGDKRILRRAAGHHLLVRILILDFAEVEATLVRDVGAGLNRIRKGREAAFHLGRRLEMPVHEPLAAIAERLDRRLFANGGDDVLQRSGFGRVIEDVARCNGADTFRARHGRKVVKTDRIVRPPSERQGTMGQRTEGIGDIVQLPRRHRVRKVGQEDSDEAFGVVGDVRPVQDTAALAAPRLADRKQSCEAAPGGAIGRIEQNGMALARLDARARYHADTGRLLPIPATNHAGDRTPVRQSHSAMAEKTGRSEQFLRRTCPA